MKISWWPSARRDVLSVLLVVAITLTAKSSFADHYYVPSGSMLPTVHIDDRVLVNKLAYGLRVPLTSAYLVKFGGPSRGHVVVLNSPEDGKVLLKRVVAVPGDRVGVQSGQLVLNGRAVPIEEHDGALVEALGASAHPLALDEGGGPELGVVTVPEDKYLVLGDNRGNSHDGRMFGFVARGEILGRATGIFYREGGVTWISL